MSKPNTTIVSIILIFILLVAVGLWYVYSQVCHSLTSFNAPTEIVALSFVSAERDTVLNVSNCGLSERPFNGLTVREIDSAGEIQVAILEDVREDSVFHDVYNISKNTVHSLTVDGRTKKGLSLSPDGKYVTFSSGDGEGVVLTVLDLRSGAEIPLPTDDARFGVFLASGDLFLASSEFMGTVNFETRNAAMLSGGSGITGPFVSNGLGEIAAKNPLIDQYTIYRVVSVNPIFLEALRFWSGERTQVVSRNDAFYSSIFSDGKTKVVQEMDGNSSVIYEFAEEFGELMVVD